MKWRIEEQITGREVPLYYEVVADTPRAALEIALEGRDEGAKVVSVLEKTEGGWKVVCDAVFESRKRILQNPL